MNENLTGHGNDVDQGPGQVVPEVIERVPDTFVVDVHDLRRVFQVAHLGAQVIVADHQSQQLKRTQSRDSFLTSM